MFKSTPFFFHRYIDFKSFYKWGKRTAYFLLLVSCSQLQEAASEKFTYSFSEGFCETGEKSFSSNAQMCSALQNNSYNNGCAQSQRQDYFYTKCSGSFTPSTSTKPIFKIQFN